MTTLWDGSGDDIWDDGEPWDEEEAAKRRAAKVHEEAERAAIASEPPTPPPPIPIRKGPELKVPPPGTLGASYVWPSPQRAWVSDYFAIAPGRPTMLCAPPGVGKGWLAQMIQWSVAGGLPMGDLGTPGVRGKTLWLDYEEGNDELWRRHAVLRAGYEPIHEPFDDGMTYVDCTLRRAEYGLHNPAFINWLREACKGVALCVVDNLAECYAAKDHDKPDAATPIRVMSEVSIETGCAFLVIYHPRKSVQNADTAKAAEGSLQDRVRGSGAIPGALGSIWVGDPTEHGKTLWRHAKCNGRKKSDSFLFSWEDQTDGGITLHTEPFIESVGGGSDLQEARRQQESVALKAEILELVQKHGQVTTRTIIAGVAGNFRRKTDAIEQLLLDGAIEESAGARGARLFRAATVSGSAETSE